MGEQLKLIQGEQTAPEPKPVSWKQEFACYFFYQHREKLHQESKLKVGALKKMLQQHVEKAWVDDETGAPEIPTLDEWKEEVDAFWEDKFAAEQVGFHFSYLLKRFGSFKKYRAVKREETDPVLTNTCKSCSHVMKAPRSKWLKFRGKVGKCSACGTTFNVNDVFGKITSLQDILPRGQQ